MGAPRSPEPGPAGEGAPCALGAPPRRRGTIAGRERRAQGERRRFEKVAGVEDGEGGEAARVEPRRTWESEPKRVEGGGGFGATGQAPRAWLDHSPASIVAELPRPRGGRRGRRSLLPLRLLEASRTAPKRFPEAPGRLGGVGSVSAPPGRERLAGGTLRFMLSFRERWVSAYCVPRAVLGA